MDQVKNGLFVSIHYKGTLANGEVFDSNHGPHPLEVEMGQGQVIKGFEEQLMGMSLNEKKVFTLTPDDAYGQRNDDYVYTFPKKELPPDAEPQVGDALTLTTEEGQEFPAMITQVNELDITVDLNHPLAGRDLTFEIEVVGISDSKTQNHAGCGCGCES